MELFLRQYSPWSKTPLSSLMLGLFCLLIAAGTLTSVFFQAPAQSNSELNRLRVLFSEDEFDHLRTLTITNRLGAFTFERSIDGKQWRMTSPRSVMANPQPLERVLIALKEIRIRRIYDKDPINSSNYSLDNPQIKISTLTDDLVEKEIHFGLVNPVDNSTYLHVLKSDSIFHVDALNFSLENLDIVNFIDTRVFATAIEQINQVKISKDGSHQNPHLSINLRDGVWVDSTDRQLDTAPVEAFLSELTNLRSLFIIDKANEELTRAIEQQFDKPAFHIELTDKEGLVFNYKVSAIVNNLPELKIERRQNFLIQTSHRDYPFLLPKENFDLFSKRNNQFTGLTIKKLFY
jgi:hypothetical protein